MQAKLRLLGLAIVSSISTSVVAANCGHDIHGAARIEESKLAPTVTITHYFSPATVVMDNPKDPMHRAFGECRGQGITQDDVSSWEGGCVWKDVDGDMAVVRWSSKPGDTGSEDRANASKGTARFVGSTGKFASLNGKKCKWTGLANGGSYFCCGD
jgi:hypothetical protein